MFDEDKMKVMAKGSAELLDRIDRILSEFDANNQREVNAIKQVHAGDPSGYTYMLGLAKKKLSEISEQKRRASHEVEKIEISIRNAKRHPDNKRPLENAGSLDCVSHELQTDKGTDQRYCSKCSWRIDIVDPWAPD